MSKKRQANSPILGKGKERKEDMSDIGSKNTHSLGMSQDSHRTAASQDSRGSSKPIRRSIFTTQKPDGAFRDEIVVEIQTLDGQPFRGRITPKEARRTIIEETLGFKQEDFIGFYFAYSWCPIVTFKLKEQFNIDSLELFQEFNVKRRCKVGNEEKMAILRCKIRGICSTQNNQTENYQDEGFRWVKVEGCEYRLEEKQIIAWLSHFGEVKSEISEDTHEGLEESSDDLLPVGNGIYSVRMKLKRDIPQLIPMHGKRIRLYYRGIIKRCTNCFGAHQRKNCKEEKVPWIKYVEQFITNFPEIPEESYGRWADMIDRMSPGVDGNKTIVPEQERESTSLGANSHQPTPKSSSRIGTRPERDADKAIMTVQLTQSTSTGVQPKITKPTMQTTKPTRQTTKENDSEMGKEEKQETARKNKSKMEEETEQEELCQAIQSLVASGMSIKEIEEFFLSGKTETKNRQRGLKLGRGRGRGRGIGSGKCRGT
jgi:hypothetical protein